MSIERGPNVGRVCRGQHQYDDEVEYVPAIVEERVKPVDEEVDRQLDCNPVREARQIGRLRIKKG